MVSLPEDVPAAGAPPPAWLDPGLRIAGAVVGVWGGVLLAVFGAFFTPFRSGAVLVPVSLVLASVATWR